MERVDAQQNTPVPRDTTVYDSNAQGLGADKQTPLEANAPEKALQMKMNDITSKQYPDTISSPHSANGSVDLGLKAKYNGPTQVSKKPAEPMKYDIFIQEVPDE